MCVCIVDIKVYVNMCMWYVHECACVHGVLFGCACPWSMCANVCVMCVSVCMCVVCVCVCERVCVCVWIFSGEFSFQCICTCTM